MRINRVPYKAIGEKMYLLKQSEINFFLPLTPQSRIHIAVRASAGCFTCLSRWASGSSTKGKATAPRAKCCQTPWALVRLRISQMKCGVTRHGYSIGQRMLCHTGHACQWITKATSAKRKESAIRELMQFFFPFHANWIQSTSFQTIIKPT